MSDQFASGRCAPVPFCPPAGGPGRAPAGRQRSDPRRARDDHNPVPYQVALAAQDLLDDLLGDEPFDLEQALPAMVRLAEFTDEGHAPDRPVWTRGRVPARVAELIEVYRLPPELGGDMPLARDADLAVVPA